MLEELLKALQSIARSLDTLADNDNEKLEFLKKNT